MSEKALCARLAKIIGGHLATNKPACVVQTLRNLNVKILGRRGVDPL